MFSSKCWTIVTGNIGMFFCFVFVGSLFFGGVVCVCVCVWFCWEDVWECWLHLRRFPLPVFLCVCLFGASFSPYDIGMLLNTCVHFQFKLVTNMTGNLGRKQRFSAFVITGNKNGLAGKLS